MGQHSCSLRQIQPPGHGAFSLTTLLNHFHSEDNNPFRSLLEAAPDGIIMCAKDGTILLANSQCRVLFGYAPQELVGQKIEVLIPEGIRQKHSDLREQYFTSPHKRPMGMGLDLMASRKDATKIPVEISLSPFSFQGTPCAIAIIRDVTEIRRLSRELKENNAELKRSNEDLEHFAYVASHDLQEPLRMVGGYTQLLARRYGDKLDQDAQEYIHYAVEGVKRMQTLISDLLTYSRLSTRPKSFVPVDMNLLLRQVLANLDRTIHEEHAQVHVENLPKVQGDGVQLAQVLQNLISNAIKFRRDGTPPLIRIKGHKQGKTAFLQVEDNGIGIESSYLDRIFVLFQRLHTRDQYPGTGIGLAICKKIIERHGGEIHVISQPGQGTTFSFTLPAESESP